MRSLVLIYVHVVCVYKTGINLADCHILFQHDFKGLFTVFQHALKSLETTGIVGLGLAAKPKANVVLPKNQPLPKYLRK